MIGLDTNLLVRIYAADDAAQRAAAIARINALPPGEKAVVNVVVVAELMWTLRSAYKFDRETLAAVARNLTDHIRLHLPEKDLVREAAHRSQEYGGDIPDHLIALLNRRYGAETTYTFDRDAARGPDFTHLSA